MNKLFAGTMLCFVMVLISPLRTTAQDATQSPLTLDAFDKLKKKALEAKQTITIPPEAKSALRLQESAGKTECKQLVAGDSAHKYFFIVSTGKDDDVFLSEQQLDGSIRMFLTNSKLELRNVVTAPPHQNLKSVANMQAMAGDFTKILQVWAQIAAGL